MLTQEQKAALCEDYKDRRNKVVDIATKYGVTNSVVCRVAVEMGAEPRLAKKYGKKLAKTTQKTCPKCKKTVDVKGAKFCCFCGSDIRSDKEKLIARIENAFADISFMPHSARDNMQQLFLDIIKELNN